MPSKLSKTSISVAAVAASLALAACGGSSSGSGGSSTVSATAYMKSVCQAVGPFKQHLQSASTALSSSNTKSPAARKQALEGFLSTFASGAQDTVQKLQQAGTPDVTNGKQISQALVSAFSQLHSALVQDQSMASTLPTGDSAAFAKASQTLGKNLQDQGSTISNSMNGLHSSELESAAKKEPSCQALAG